MVQGASNSEVWLRQVIFFSLWVGRVAPLFSGEDTVQGKEEKRVKKKKRVVTFGRSAGRFGRDKTDTDRQAWTCGRVDRQERGEREPWKGGMYLVVVVGGYVGVSKSK